jgi:hypothetical protein
VLKHVKKSKSGELFDAFAEDLLAERSVRPLIIVGASKIDQLLFEMLRGFLLPKIAKSGNQDELLEGDNPLGAFSARIKICRRLGLIDETLYVTLEQLRRIRNLSAHEVSFDHARPPVRDRLAEFKRLVSGRGSYSLTRDRYFDTSELQPIEELQCLLLTLCVLLEAAREKVRPTPGNKRALSISAR